MARGPRNVQLSLSTRSTVRYRLPVPKGAATPANDRSLPFDPVPATVISPAPPLSFSCRFTPQHCQGPGAATVSFPSLQTTQDRASTASVHIGSMFDPEYRHQLPSVVDLVHDPVRAAAGRPHAGQFALELVADTAGFLDKGAEHELDDRGCDALCQSGQATFRACGDDQFVLDLGHRCKYLARSSSAVRTRPFAASVRAA